MLTLLKKFLKKEKTKQKWRSVVDPATQSWYFLDERNHVFVCDETQDVCLDVTINDQLALEGEARDLTRKVAEIRKLLNLKEGEQLPDFEVIEPRQDQERAINP